MPWTWLLGQVQDGGCTEKAKACLPLMVWLKKRLQVSSTLAAMVCNRMSGSVEWIGVHHSRHLRRILLQGHEKKLRLDMNIMFAIIEEFTDWSKLHFNVAKCTAPSASHALGRASEWMILQSEFTLSGWVILTLKWEDQYKHLGVLLGPNLEAWLDELAVDSRENTVKIFQSGLCDWIEQEALWNIVIPTLDYAFRSNLVHRKWDTELDCFTRITVKHLLGLLRRYWTPLEKNMLLWCYCR